MNKEDFEQLYYDELKKNRELVQEIRNLLDEISVLRTMISLKKILKIMNM